MSATWLLCVGAPPAAPPPPPAGVRVHGTVPCRGTVKADGTASIDWTAGEGIEAGRRGGVGTEMERGELEREGRSGTERGFLGTKRGS